MNRTYKTCVVPALKETARVKAELTAARIELQEVRRAV